jgi:5-hydroxyisourate hydrolase-like protein (transthyretin family)
MKIEEQKKKMQQEEEEANQRVSDYFKSKTKGKTGTFEIFWAIKDDF